MQSLFARSNTGGGCWVVVDSGAELVRLVATIMCTAGQGHNFALYSEEVA